MGAGRKRHPEMINAVGRSVNLSQPGLKGSLRAFALWGAQIRATYSARGRRGTFPEGVADYFVRQWRQVPPPGCSAGAAVPICIAAVGLPK